MKELRLEIEELEERIAPIVDPFLALLPHGGVSLPAEGGGVQAVQHDGIDPPGACNDGVNNPAGVGAPVPQNNPGVGP